MTIPIRARYIMFLAALIMGVGVIALLYVWARFYLWTIVSVPLTEDQAVIDEEWLILNNPRPLR